MSKPKGMTTDQEIEWATNKFKNAGKPKEKTPEEIKQEEETKARNDAELIRIHEEDSIRKRTQSEIWEQERLDNIEKEKARSRQRRKANKKAAIDRIEEAKQHKIYVSTPTDTHIMKYCEDTNKKYYRCLTVDCNRIMLDPELEKVSNTIERTKDKNTLLTSAMRTVKKDFLWCESCKREFSLISVKNSKIMLKLYERMKENEKKIKNLETKLEEK